MNIVSEKNLRLVTFDVFGTLLDWRNYAEKLFPGQFTTFLEHSEALQRIDLPVLPYSRLLEQVAQRLGLPADAAQHFGKSFGKIPAFRDADALQNIGRLVALGALSNSDYRHQIEAQRTLGIQWDALQLSEDLGAYKPMREFWDRAVARVTKELRIKPDQWLHVSAYVDYDLVPAKERGLRTCFLPRPGGTPAAHLRNEVADLVVSDLHQLLDFLREAFGDSVLYSVTATAKDGATAKRFQDFVRNEHGPDVLKTQICQRFQIAVMSDLETRCEYTFAHQAALDNYLQNFSSGLRAKTAAQFAEGCLTFARQNLPLLFESSLKK